MSDFASQSLSERLDTLSMMATMALEAGEPVVIEASDLDALVDDLRAELFA